MRRVRLALGMAVAGVLLGGCTLVPTDVAPRVVPASDVPSGLLTGRPLNRSATVNLTFLDADNNAVAVATTQEAPVTVRVVTSALAVPPVGLRSVVPSSLSVLRAIVHGNECEVTLASGLSILPAPNRRLAILQIGRSLQALFGATGLSITDASTGVTYRWVGSSGR